MIEPIEVPGFAECSPGHYTPIEDCTAKDLRAAIKVERARFADEPDADARFVLSERLDAFRYLLAELTQPRQRVGSLWSRA